MTSGKSYCSNDSSGNQFEDILAKRATGGSHFKVVKENLTLICIYLMRHQIYTKFKSDTL
jgi:hypothetical protein